MLIAENGYEPQHVKFVSYTGRWPNLCRGVLTLVIDGEICKFGHESGDFDFEKWKYKDGNFDAFWESGGEARYSGTTQYPWKVYQKKLPEHLEKYALEIDRVFNDNVHFGCCGGCL